jgi:hypothetical protein
MKTIPKDKTNCEALIRVQNELKLPPVNTDLWLSLPRIFTRSSARFELPLDSRTLESMTPLYYIQNHVSLSSPRKLLYNCIFNKFKMDSEIESNGERKIRGAVCCVFLLTNKLNIDTNYTVGNPEGARSHDGQSHVGSTTEVLP